MKVLITMGLFLLSFYYCKAQEKNTIRLDGKKIEEMLIKDFKTSKETYIMNRVLGVEVSVLIDTVFNKYTVVYTDENGKKEWMVFSFIRHAASTGGGALDFSQDYYYMQYEGMDYLLLDFTKYAGIHSIEIRKLDLLPNNCTKRYLISSLKLVE